MSGIKGFIKTKIYLSICILVLKHTKNRRTSVGGRWRFLAPEMRPSNFECQLGQKQIEEKLLNLQIYLKENVFINYKTKQILIKDHLLRKRVKLNEAIVLNKMEIA